MNLHRVRTFRQLIEEHPRMAWIYRVDQGRHLPEQYAVPTDRGNCRRRGGSGCGSVRGMDAAAKPPR
ncbi:hypothetical protein C7E17_13830 [Stenotrophomonas maltophilia]|nr:hypothetical protein C7E17_23515 [Stenotrophomonas maltophilia]PSD31046.1 hypothetical protein C7E17_13830 [Stenotrophomonas maltophilia]